MDNNQQDNTPIGLVISDPAYLSTYEKLALAEYHKWQQLDGSQDSSTGITSSKPQETQDMADTCLVGLHDEHAIVSVGEDCQGDSTNSDFLKPVKISEIHKLLSSQEEPKATHTNGPVYPHQYDRLSQGKQINHERSRR